MNKRFDDELDAKVRESLLEETNSALELKDEIWRKIEAGIDKREASVEGKADEKSKNENESMDTIKMEGKRKMRTEKRSRKNNRKRMFGIGTVAAALLIFFFTSTAPGHAAIDRIREIFAPEKNIIEEIEGIQEERNVNLQQSKLGYIIYFDEEMFKMETVNGVDRISPINQADYVPEVYMEIKQVEDKDMDTIAAELDREMKNEFEIFRHEGLVQKPIQGILLLGQRGYNWDDIVVKYYLVDNGKDGTFVIKQHFFVEASEGFGARFDNMLKEFRIVELDK